MRKTLVGYIAAIAMLLFASLPLITCKDTVSPGDSTNDSTFSTIDSPSNTWAIYWYVCGSDLETDDGSATADLLEMAAVTLPPEVTVVIQTGGAKKWQHPSVKAGELGRYVYDQNGLKKAAALRNASMGKAETLASFLSFSLEQYPADKKMLIVWNHGGGSLNGVAFDENYDNDSLTLSEIRQAFSSACELSQTEPPFEVIGFDACLMATIDVANVSKDIARYLVASEETEPGLGWNYTGILDALAKNPQMDGKELGVNICNSYYAACKAEDSGDDITLSVTDLAKIPALLTAYESLGLEALSKASSDAAFITQLSKTAKRIESYGSNSKMEGYTNMADLGDLVRKSSSLLPETANAVLDTLDECVVYKLHGARRSQASGLSCYYPYDMDKDNLDTFSSLGTSKSLSYYYEYNIEGNLSPQGKSFLAAFDPSILTRELPSATVESLLDYELDDFPVVFNDDYAAELRLGREIADVLTGVYYYLEYEDPDENVFYRLGIDNDLFADWDKGVFTDNFTGQWLTIDGHYIYSEVEYESNDYDLYTVPIVYNGKKNTLHLSYDYHEEEWTIIGVNRGLLDNGMTDKNMRKLKPGDVIIPIFYMIAYHDKEGKPIPIEQEPFTVTRKTEVRYEMLWDGEYSFVFEMVDAQGNSAFSEYKTFEIEDGEVYSLLD
ncbi:clostripain-related cysteine peptidase [Breznakiellaceae bacterium SP9]